MHSLSKYAGALALAGAIAAGAATPCWARNDRSVGSAAGAATTVAAKGSDSEFYYGEPAYGFYEPGKAREPAYSYAPAAKDRHYASGPAPRRCWVETDSTRGFGYYGSCTR